MNALVQDVPILLKRHRRDDGFILVSVDIRNVYNCIDLQRMLDLLSSKACLLARLVKTVYRLCTLLLIVPSPSAPQIQAVRVPSGVTPPACSFFTHYSSLHPIHLGRMRPYPQSLI